MGLNELIKSKDTLYAFGGIILVIFTLFSNEIREKLGINKIEERTKQMQENINDIRFQYCILLYNNKNTSELIQYLYKNIEAQTNQTNEGQMRLVILSDIILQKQTEIRQSILEEKQKFNCIF